MFNSRVSVPLLAATCTSLVHADYLGPRYPYPVDLTSDTSLIPGSFNNLTAQLNSIIQNDADPIGATLRNLTFSVGLFSLHDLDAATTPSLQYHNTGPEVANSPIGVNEVDGDSIYGIASITKLITIYAGLLNLKKADWDRSLTEFFPQLSDNSKDVIDTIQWDEVTLWSLASHLSGSALNPWPLADLTFDPITEADPNDPESIVAGVREFALARGLPPLSAEELLAMATGLGTDSFDPDAMVEYLSQRPPRFQTWSNPGYSNNAYILFTPLLQNITGKPIDELFGESIFSRLGMSNTVVTPPPESEYSKYVILGEADVASIALPPGLTATSGGVRSSIHDLALLGTSILNSTLLAGDQTRKWMKPITHTDRFEISIGAPWEIVRYTHESTGTVTDVYCKSGESGSYVSFLCLMPDFGAGFTILSASLTVATRSALIGQLGNQVIEAYLPALLAQSKLEAQKNFIGTYKSNVEGLNSYMTVSLNETEGALPGLIITEFISNNTDVYTLEQPLLTRRRLQPSIEDRGTNRIAFRTPRSTSIPSGNAGLVAALAASDAIVSGPRSWGNEDLDLFIFDVDAQGRAVAVSPAAFRVKLERVEEE